MRVSRPLVLVLVKLTEFYQNLTEFDRNSCQIRLELTDFWRISANLVKTPTKFDRNLIEIWTELDRIRPKLTEALTEFDRIWPKFDGVWRNFNLARIHLTHPQQTAIYVGFLFNDHRARYTGLRQSFIKIDSFPLLSFYLTSWVHKGEVSSRKSFELIPAYVSKFSQRRYLCVYIDREDECWIQGEFQREGHSARR